MGYLLGIDLGSSSVKAALLDAETGFCAASAFYPKTEMRIDSPRPGFAEQNPEDWLAAARSAVCEALAKAGAKGGDVQAVGIAYQMHGLVCVDKAGKVLRPAIIWCDSRAVPYGEAAAKKIGKEKCLDRLLNTPGNFTAAKLAWVKENEPEIFAKIDKILLPGDWLALRLTGAASTTASGLSEGIFWDFQADEPCRFLLDTFGFAPELLAPLVPTFGIQGALTADTAKDFGLKPGTPVSYRAGDQPNNAFSLKALQPGEVAATAGTSGVVYGVTDKKQSDPLSRVNTFLHVNHKPAAPRLGVLLCVSGCGILNSWTRRLLGNPSYEEMNALAASAEPGAKGISIFPFGNGAERMLGSRSPGASVVGLDFNRHGRAEICRAAQEGVAFAIAHGMEAMRESGVELRTLRAGQANMFLSETFGQTLADCGGAMVELFDTDGALGAARGAGVGAGVYATCEEACGTLRLCRRIEPGANRQAVAEAYALWKKRLSGAVGK